MRIISHKILNLILVIFFFVFTPAYIEVHFKLNASTINPDQTTSLDLGP